MKGFSQWLVKVIDANPRAAVIVAGLGGLCVGPSGDGLLLAVVRTLYGS